MSTSERRTRENGCELAPYTNWPLILGAAALLVAGGVAVGLMPRARPAVPPGAGHRRVAVAPVARCPIREEAAAPAPAVEEPEPVARPIAVERVEMLGKPRIETAASLALERMTFDRVDSPTLVLRSPRLRLAASSEEEMLRLLERSKEVDIGGDAHAALTGKMRPDGAKGEAEASHRALAALVRGRADLTGLPLVAMKDCVLSKEESKALARVSASTRGRRGSVKSSEPRERHGSTATLRLGPAEVVATTSRYRAATAARSDASASSDPIPAYLVRPLRQVYEVQPEKGRVALAGVIAQSKSAEAARALVRLAVFDLSEGVREEAVRQLVTQDAGAVRAELLAAFRHPWPPAAVHAAKAADRLGDRRLVPALKELLQQPDPARPFQDKGLWYVRELVRVNHLENCLLCHPPAGTSRPALGGPVPRRDREVPVAYYGSRDKSIPLVDAATVYLWQDFSVLHVVKDAKPWPEVQRFDYLVRTRPLRADEIPKGGARADLADFTYPQREAVRALLGVLDDGEAGRREP